MLAIEPIRLHRVYNWAISQIVTRDSTDSDNYDSWDDMLECKRADTQYPWIVESLKTNGFVRPLNATTCWGQLQLSDGHHRVAAAIDMGMDTVPVYVAEDDIISSDSGLWNPRRPISPLESDYIIIGKPLA